jgi:hypothetical protein
MLEALITPPIQTSNNALGKVLDGLFVTREGLSTVKVQSLNRALINAAAASSPVSV